jgi:hypothetical protein
MPIGCYGKLPFWPEYLAAGPPARVAGVLREWLHAGFVETDGERAGRLRYVIGDTGEGELMAGVLRPSEDQGGLRSFPFTVHVTFPRHAVGSKYPLVIAGMDMVWDALDDAWEALAGMSSADAFREHVASIRIPLPRERAAVRPLYESYIASSADRVFGADPASGPEPLAEGLPRTIASIRETPAERALVIALPVGANLDEAPFDIAFWLDVIGRQFTWRRPEPAVFLEADAGRAPREVRLVHGPLAAAPFADVVVGGTVRPGVCYPARSRAGALQAAGSAPTLRQILAHRFRA